MYSWKRPGIIYVMLDTTNLVEHFPYVGIFILLILGEIGLPFPEDATLILSGFLMSQRVTKPLPTLIVVYCGLLLTDFSLFWVGKKYGRMVIEHKRFRRILSAERLVTLEEKFRKWGIYVVFVGRHFLGIRAQVFLVAGVMRMSSLKFVMADAASAILTMTLMVGIGFWGGNSLQVLQKDLKRVEHIGILALLSLFTAWVIYKYFRNRRI